MATSQTQYRATSLGEVLKHQGRSVTWLSGQAGVSRAWGSRIVNRTVMASSEIAEKMSAALGVPIAQLFDEEEDTRCAPTPLEEPSSIS